MTVAPEKAAITKTRPLSDSTLVEMCLQNSEDAWGALIAKYKNLIFSIPVRYGFSEEDSSDIFQTVCMDLLTELPRLREPKALGGWLIQVTRNKCYHRKQAQQRQTVQEVEDLDAFPSPAETDELVQQIEQEQVLREALSNLSPRCGQLVNMLFFEMPARPYEQVAKELDLAAGSIGFIRRRCLDRLREELKDRGFDLA